MPGWRDLPGQSAVRDQPAPRDQPTRLPAADRPEHGSRADLQQRLDALPPDHPSSPRSADRASSDRADSNRAETGRGDRAETDRGDRAETGRSDRAEADRAEADRAEADRADWADPQRADRADREQPGVGEPTVVEDHGPDGHERDYWRQTARFERLWAEHVERWPDERLEATVDRSRDPAGSWRGSGNQYLSREQHERTEHVIAGVRTAEKTISEHMREIEQDNTSGSRLAGWGCRLKGDDRLKEKIAEKVEHEPGRTPADSMRGVNDAVRYTFCSEPATYQDAYWNIKGMLEERGYTMFYSKNHWRDDPEYKGINSRWVTPEGQRFELQFHTPESFNAKQEVTHDSYERIRNPLTVRSEQRELNAFQREVSSWISTPGDLKSIPDYEEVG